MGEVEDGEYDWMKLNGGRGYEASKSYGQHHHLHAAHGQNTSARDIHGSRSPRAGVTPDRLNAAQPPPPSPAKPGVGKVRERPNASGVPHQAKRPSGLAGAPPMEATPAASTQAQFGHSNGQLARTASNQPPQGMATTGAGGVGGPAAAAAARDGGETQPSVMQRLLKALCCG